MSIHQRRFSVVGARNSAGATHGIERRRRKLNSNEVTFPLPLAADGRLTWPPPPPPPASKQMVRPANELAGERLTCWPRDSTPISSPRARIQFRANQSNRLSSLSPQLDSVARDEASSEKLRRRERDLYGNFVRPVPLQPAPPPVVVEAAKVICSPTFVAPTAVA